MVRPHEFSHPTGMMWYPEFYSEFPIYDASGTIETGEYRIISGLPVPVVRPAQNERQVAAEEYRISLPPLLRRLGLK